MGFGVIDIEGSAGSQTAPTSVNVSFGSEIGSTLLEYGLYQPLHLPELRSTFFSHGLLAMRHIMAGSSYRIGLLAPQAAQTLAGAGARATSTHTFTAATNPLDGDVYNLYGNSVGKAIKFKTTLSSPPVFYQLEVKIGATLAATIGNIQAFINGTATNGTEAAWNTAFWTYPIYGATVDPIEVSATTGTTVTYRSINYGTGGNSFTALEITDGGASWTISAFSGGTDSGTTPAQGTYQYAYQHLRQGDGALSGRSATASISLSGPGNVNQTVFVAGPTRDADTHYRTLRSPSGDPSLWKIADTTEATGEPYVDSMSDTTLTGVAGNQYDSTIYRLYEAGYPTVGRYCARYKGQVWIGGATLAADYTSGTVNVTNGSYTVTFSATSHPKELWVGRTLKIDNDTVEYLITTISESAKTGKLNIPFQGSNNATANYTVSDKRNPFSLYNSEALLPNNWPVRDNVDVLTTSSSDPFGISGLRASWTSLIVWTRTGVWRVDGSPDSGFRLANIGEGMGCFSGFSVVDVEGVLYWLGRDGIFRWDGSGDPTCLSRPKSQTGQAVTGVQGTIDRINLDEAEMIVADYNPSTRLIRWCVPLDGDTTNRYVIVYDTNSGAFALDTCEDVTFIASLSIPYSGAYVTFMGDAYGGIFQTDLGTCDGVFGVEPIQAFSAWTASTLTATGLSSIPTASGGIAGVPVLHISAAGAIQRNKAVSNTATTIQFARPWATTPADGTFILGGIWLDIQTARYDFNSPDTIKWLIRVVLSFVPQTKGRVYYGAGADADDPAMFANRSLGVNDYANLTASEGEKRFQSLTDRGRRLVQRFVALTPGYDVQMIGYVTFCGSQTALQAAS